MLLYTQPLYIEVIFTCFIEKGQPKDDGEGLSLLQTELNGEIYVTSVLGYLKKLRVRNVGVNVQ